MNKGYIIEILQEKFPKCEDSFWYYGEDIAKADFPNGKKLFVMASGHIRVQFEVDGVSYKDQQAVDKAIELGLNDKDLAKVSLFDGWHNNNWFVVREFDINGNEIGDDIAIAHDYNEAIELLEVVAMEKIKEYYS